MAILSEILRFILPPTKTRAAEFLNLRQHIAKTYNIRDQYFGYVIPFQGTGLPVRDHEMCWVIQWPSPTLPQRTTESHTQLNNLLSTTASSTSAHKARSLLFPFPSSSLPEVTKALTSPVCEFAIINLSSTAPKVDISFNRSMEKTFTDCYFAEGFKGGAWAYAVNTNDTDGTIVTDAEGMEGEVEEVELLKLEERRLACYYLGWESVELHHKYSQTALFAEEIDKLAPHFGPGTGAWYVKFEKHVE
ncbi:hypothetical protein H2200_012042 [Cladophialophora chaetospira]|uniref:Uncharacterized protein n=1 Tax=Cladophialophora chaetospira TaxID=386627 RepID=A0AA38WY46_9EURO|nr:hypothetical protein H2200_012042 [Cladophialophora chaetospira]